MWCFLNTPRAPYKARNHITAMYNAAKAKGVNCVMSAVYQPCDALVLYGLGGADRFQVGMRHVQAGKPLLVWDLGYWDRNLPVNRRKYRFSLNGMHPTQVMLGAEPNDKRWRAAGLSIETVHAKGPIMLVGNAPKSIAIGAGGWTAQKSQELRKRFPSKKIIYRPKPKRPIEPGVVYDEISNGPIDEELRKVSLVVCRHSNVAVDACRLGVPVVCDDGAAALIYPRKLEYAEQQPALEKRVSFLHRLAYWQWSANESPLFWDWFFKTFPAYDNR